MYNFVCWIKKDDVKNKINEEWKKLLKCWNIPNFQQSLKSRLNDTLYLNIVPAINLYEGFKKQFHADAKLKKFKTVSKKNSTEEQAQRYLKKSIIIWMPQQTFIVENWNLISVITFQVQYSVVLLYQMKISKINLYPSRDNLSCFPQISNRIPSSK